jgi:antitoxin (DNA-binding transcriptional repressor) of toxin-antitoxin stability system
VIKVDLAQAEHQLSHLIEEAAGGEEVLIAREDGLTFRIVLQDSPPRPRFGSAKGLIRMAEDFDQPLDDFKDYMP